MDTYLRPLVSCGLYTTIIRQKKLYKDGKKPVVANKQTCYQIYIYI